MTADFNSFDSPYTTSENQGSILTRSSAFNPAAEQLNAEKIYGINNPSQPLPQQQVHTPMQNSTLTVESMAENMNVPVGDNQSLPQNSLADDNINPVLQIQNLYNRSFDSEFVDNSNISPINIPGLSAVNSDKITNLNEFLKTQIGSRVSVDFLIGADTIISKSGYLVAAATDFIAINELNTNDVTTCDFNNIKFIRFFY